MMVETILESSQDFGMSGGVLPQWKRELLQRRAARSRPAPPAAPPPPPPPPPPADEDEELRYGPGIVKRLKSRYLSLALRDAPRRRPSVLRRATSLEHLLETRPPPAPAPRHSTRPPRPVSVAAPPALADPVPHRRDSVKRARSVDALSRLVSRDDPLPPASPPPPPPLAPRPPPMPRAARVPRRPTPLLRETERPPPDLVRSTLRKFESAPTRRTAPAARVSAVLRGLEGPRTSTPEPREGPEIAPPLSPRTPSPLPPSEPPPPVPPSVDEPADAGARLVSRAALDGIARAGSSVLYAFEAPRAGSHLPPLAATNPVLLGRARRIGVIRPMPARTADDTLSNKDDGVRKSPEPAPRLSSPSPTLSTEVEPATSCRTERKDPPPAALVEPIPRTLPEPTLPATPPPPVVRESSPVPNTNFENKLKTDVSGAPLVNGHAPPDAKGCVVSRIGAAGIERAWSGSAGPKVADTKKEKCAPWAQDTDGSPALVRRVRAPPAATSVVFNFSSRKEVPDYVENDGIILRASRRDRIKPGESGVVVLRPEALARSDSEEEEVDCGPPSPCSVRFVNDNVLINGKSSMPARPNKDRVAKLKLQFDDSLTRTFEYPSEVSLCEEPPRAEGAEGRTPQLAESPVMAALAANTHITSAALSNYTPSKTISDVFQLGVTRHDAREHDAPPQSEEEAAGEECSPGAADAEPHAWSAARTHATDLLF